MESRRASDADYAAVIASRVRLFADCVLGRITSAPGMVLLDIGAGSGAVGLRENERLGDDVADRFCRPFGQEGCFF